MTEEEELRALHAKAYGPNGTLTDVEAERLRALQSRGDEAERPIESEDAESAGGAQLPAESESARESPAESMRSAARWRLPAIVGVAALLLGAVAGWAFAQQPRTALEVGAQQQERADAVIGSGGFDAGSERAVAELDGAVAWSATKDAGEQICLFIVGSADDASIRIDCARRAKAIAGEVIATQIIQRPESGWPVVLSVTGLVTRDGDVAASMVEKALPTAESAGLENDEELGYAEGLVLRGFDPESIRVAARHDADTAWVARRDGSYCMLIRSAEQPAPDPQCVDEEASTWGVVNLGFDGEPDLMITLSVLPGGIPEVVFEEVDLKH